MIQPERYLALDERKIWEVRRHAAVLLGPFLQMAAVLVVAGFLGALASHVGAASAITTILGLVVLAFVIRLASTVVQWWLTRIIVTDRRIVEVSGVVSRRVASMPLPQVTDTTYHRSVGGRLLGYGDLIVESPGRHPGLSHIDHVPRPDDFYRIVMSLMNASSGDAPDEVVVYPVDAPDEVVLSSGNEDTGEIPRVVLFDHEEADR
ncbi:MAG TPA: PH domain-containing protein [Actinomycetota bacterium]|nr:PH domain-containing protein [Actinomycetota bacterium]